MNKRITVICFALLVALSARAQIVFTDSMMGQLAQVKVAVVDSTNAEPVPFASVYLTESKDSTINHFTLTDNKGLAELEDVPYGVYFFHIEMMGYRPWVKEMRFDKWRVDMGTVKLQVDDEFIKAAVVTDVGNPIIIKKDTIEYNASSFQVGANAMLKDLHHRGWAHVLLRRPVDGAQQPAGLHRGQDPRHRQGIGAEARHRH